MSERDYTDDFKLAKHAYDDGFSHHLAQVHINSNVFFIDPSLWQYEKLTGSPYVGTTLPEEYVGFEDSVSLMDRIGVGPEEYNMEEIAPRI